jgi:hypothetical protein
MEDVGMLTHKARKALEGTGNAHPGVYLDEDALYGVYVDLEEACLV